ncbi:T9SS type A sorting domain-containing protein [Polaribacter sp. R2A056_3_33]|uniref:T9SS type A sorting domain-containing protein n=1 Tax=Polaribacter sp. R2A056_3_33 TaxID=2745563 RepID=UPI001C5017E2|nr:T9SS type A sorting domain-containing protein [Polaribacter sp. R2A056_3_33]QXP71413.1 T9SS type A sorting domain-containing protein [Polaribacter sp. R2A056_3_33]
MKKNYIFTLLFTFYLTGVSFGQVILSESFSYSNGSLTSTASWENVSGTEGDLLVSSGQAVVEHGTPSEDANIAFTAVSGDIYVGFDFSVDDLGDVYSGSDNEYFAHIDFKARIDIVPATNGGDYSVGIASTSSTAEAIWATDLIFDQKYRAIVKFDQEKGIAQLWINPTVSTDTSISGSEIGSNTLDSFDFRQSDSSENETVRVDDLMIGQTFEDVLVFEEATASLSKNSIEGFTTYPNPITDKSFTISSNSSDTKEVSLFSVIGKRVFSTSFSGLKKNLDVSAINSGVYILKVTEAGKTATKKLVIR